MTKYILIILIFFSVLPLKSQVPGYMGKKLLFNLDIGTIPIADYLLSASEGSFMLIKPSLSVEYMISRSVSFGLFGEKANFAAQVEPYYDADNTLPVRLSQNTYGFTLKGFSFQSSGSIAPLGRYYFLEGGIIRTNVSDDGTYYPSGKKEIGDFSTFFASVGYGRQHIFKDFIMSDLGFKIGLPFGSIDALSYDRLIDDPIEHSVGLKWFSTFIFNIYFGIGLIAL